MEKRNLTCICCPIGCQIEITLDGKEVKSITGNNCQRGYNYAKEETVRPVRVVTSTVRLDGGALNMVSVKTDGAVPKDMINQCMEEINSVHAKAPIKVGDVVIEDVAGTGIKVVATKSIERV